MRIVILLISLFTLFKIEAKTCPEGTYLVQGHSRQAYYRNDGTYVSMASVSSYCRHYRNDGPLKEQFLTSTPKRWPHKTEKFKTCSKARQTQISGILKSIPKVLTNVGKLKFYCAKESTIPNNPAASLPKSKIIVLYNSSFKKETKRIIVHELAHLLWTRLSHKERKSYSSASQWIKVDGIFIYNRTSFSAPDGKNSPEEDFANNIEYFFADPVTFQNNFPQINLWIKKFLGDNK